MNFTDPSPSPVDPAKAWFDQAVAEKISRNPLTMSLSTVSSEGLPSSRMVLLKGFDDEGAVFYTNYQSLKAQEIDHNSNVSLLFHWDSYERQLRIQGRAKKVSGEESDRYFASRDRLSRIGAWSSRQSEPLKSRTALIGKVAMLTARWVGREIPRPEFWGGYRVSLDLVEFWQGHEGRLHDRIRYIRKEGGWEWLRLQP